MAIIWSKQYLNNTVAGFESLLTILCACDTRVMSEEVEIFKKLNLKKW